MSLWQYQLSKSKKKEDKKFLAEFKHHKQDYAEKLLFLYMARCKLVQRFAFIHYRSLFSWADNVQLEAQFDILKDKTSSALEMLLLTASKPLHSIPLFISTRKSVMSGFAGLIFKMQMEMKREVKKLENVLVLNPFDKQSMNKVK